MDQKYTSFDNKTQCNRIYCSILHFFWEEARWMHFSLSALLVKYLMSLYCSIYHRAVEVKRESIRHNSPWSVEEPWNIMVHPNRLSRHMHKTNHAGTFLDVKKTSDRGFYNTTAVQRPRLAQGHSLHHYDMMIWLWNILDQCSYIK
jgi:hypothetical protein